MRDSFFSPETTAPATSMAAGADQVQLSEKSLLYRSSFDHFRWTLRSIFLEILDKT